MKFHTALRSGRWVGGFTCRRDNIREALDELKPVAAQWGEPIIATRIDRSRTRDERYRIDVTRVVLLENES